MLAVSSLVLRCNTHLVLDAVLLFIPSKYPLHFRDIFPYAGSGCRHWQDWQNGAVKTARGARPSHHLHSRQKSLTTRVGRSVPSVN